MNIVALLDSNVRKTPDKPFLRYAGQSITYAEIDAQSRRAATVFAAHGVQAGDRVAAMCFNTPGFVAAMLGAWRLGAVVVPINHKMQAPEVDYILAHAVVKLCVFDGDLTPIVTRLQTPVTLLSIGAASPGVASFDALLASAAPHDAPPPADDALAEILYTSGTTGRPKGCLLSHRSVCIAAMTSALALSMHRDERTLMAMPLWHSSPLNNWMLGTLYVGGTVILLREYHPLHFLQAAQDERATLYFGAPVSYLLPLQMKIDVAAFDLSSVRAWIYGGGPIGADTARQLAALYRSDRFYQVFGMTETGPSGTVLYPEEQIAKAGSIGRVATPGVDMRVVREDGADAGPGEIGEIWLKADSTMQGYLDNDAATREVLRDGWYRSGDLVRRDADGFLFVVDRTKDMIITGGENVYSKEVEDVLAAHPDIQDAAVIGRPHDQWGETVVAVLVAKPGTQPDPEAIKAFVAERLARYKVPREFVMRDALPRTPTGKLMKHVLRSDVT
ncbi:class I adenylate-forming enzyme family protein [Ralstonia flatus]|uniref:Long-chain-fatty-acid--CoA ligase n=1 Tax=Ralstonia flatus TaxID=3058601 RepID=A0AAD2C0H4_9RALS|nr:AMP-binding protein [Ralstonia sp. LMG 32965]MBN6207775.1 AMP-binding protein [Ralstonia pickettii]CAJ0887940.1 Long-chain-fatty-acid--CoA ligase [Ralstonia sp. LMG 32965]CAJ0900474.1 Long-chain-fatty-acid--CoA ligase [Ralstonia sp. LMG 32965]